MQNLTNPPQEPGNSYPNPFIDDVFVDNITALPGVPEIHNEPMSHCVRLFENLIRDGERGQHWGNSGRTILIASPRAGYGKSHLVGRLRSVTESLVAGITLPFDPSRTIGWPVMLASVLRQYREARCPQHVGCSLLDETARFFLSNVIQAAMAEGAVQERDLPESEVALRVQFRDVMAPDAGTKMIPWLRKRNPGISEAASRPMSSRWKLPARSVSFWTGLYLNHVDGIDDALEPLRGLSNGEARERLIQFLRIATECRPAAFVADHLDGFFGSDTAGMAIAEILTSLRTEVPRSLTLLCLNEDVWQSVFEKRLPSAWLDRLTGEPATLGGIGAASAKMLISARMQAMGFSRDKSEQFALRLSQKARWESPESPVLYPREVIRAARQSWDQIGTQVMNQPEPMSSAPKPEPQVQAPVQAPAPGIASLFQPTQPTENSSVEPPANPIASQMDAHRTGQKTAPANQPPTPQSPPVTEPPRNPPQPAQPAPDLPPIETPPSPARNLTEISSIIDEIRGAGTRSVSETDLPKQFQAGDLQVTNLRPDVAPAKQEQADDQNSPSLQPLPSTAPVQPVWADDPEQHLQDLEMELLTSDSGPKPWNLNRIGQLIREVGRQYSGVAQVEEAVPGSRDGCLRWTVKNQIVMLGFESPRNVAFWNTVLQRAIAASGSAKVTVLSHQSDPFDARSLASFGVDQATAMRYIDVVELSEGDVALLYASERFLAESDAAGHAEAAIAMIARRLDPFWRRLARPLSTGSTASGSPF
ncbi:MAG: hypothetical protein HKN23_10290 [Verrucomicrobiales bacterium]|nr:hypothetical protein [Verrucomicrobiales bacterium]